MRHVAILAVLLAGCSSASNSDYEKRLAAIEAKMEEHDRRMENLRQSFLKSSEQLGELHQTTSKMHDENLKLLTRMEQFLGR